MENGRLSSIAVQTGGSGYAAPPTVVIAPRLDFARGVLGWWKGEGNTSDELGTTPAHRVPSVHSRFQYTTNLDESPIWATLTRLTLTEPIQVCHD